MQFLSAFCYASAIFGMFCWYMVILSATKHLAAYWTSLMVLTWLVVTIIVAHDEMLKDDLRQDRIAHRLMMLHLQMRQPIAPPAA